MWFVGPERIRKERGRRIVWDVAAVLRGRLAEGVDERAEASVLCVGLGSTRCLCVHVVTLKPIP